MGRLTQNILQRVFPTTPLNVLSAWVAPLNQACDTYDISSPARVAAFLAQVGHESGNLTATVENLNYSQSGLLRTFGKYFTSAQAAKYARNPQMIGSRVYANRMGNGNEISQDGWTYRGRGLIQLTGCNAYTNFSKEMKLDCPKTVLYLETPEGAAMSAAWFWNTNGLNSLADAGRFTDITKRINGGVNGLEARQALWALARKYIA